MKPIGTTRSLHERLVEELRTAIVSGELTPDGMYSVEKLAKELGVSRTPVREALLTLAGQGMVEFRRNRGVEIKKSTTHDLHEVFQLRLLLEVPAARETTARMTPALRQELRTELDSMHAAAERDDVDEMWQHDRRFHWLILHGTGNKRLADYVDSLRDLVLTRGTTTAGRSRSAAEIVAEHDAIMAPMERGNAHAAAAAMHDHIWHTAQLLIAQEAGTNIAIQDIDWTR
jgi:DNA-binding GntR family transcriptional regulator